MHQMQTIAINDPGRLSVSVTRLHCANTAERIEVLLGAEPSGHPRNMLSDTSPDFSDRFDAAFAKLLWPLVLFCANLDTCLRSLVWIVHVNEKMWLLVLHCHFRPPETCAVRSCLLTRLEYFYHKLKLHKRCVK